MERSNILPSLLLLMLTIGNLTGCATTGKSIGLGAAGGAAFGAGVGALADPGPKGRNRIRNVLIGAGIGAAAGAGAGLLVQKGNEASESEGFDKGKLAAQKEKEAQANSLDPQAPKLIPARTEARWVPDVVRGNTFIPAHFEYQIVEGARWDR